MSYRRGLREIVGKPGQKGSLDHQKEFVFYPGWKWELLQGFSNGMKWLTLIIFLKRECEGTIVGEGWPVCWLLQLPQLFMESSDSGQREIFPVSKIRAQKLLSIAKEERAPVTSQLPNINETARKVVSTMSSRECDFQGGH